MFYVASLFVTAVCFIGNYISNRSYYFFCFWSILIFWFFSKSKEER